VDRRRPEKPSLNGSGTWVGWPQRAWFQGVIEAESDSQVMWRFFAWIGRNRRLAMDFEATIASATAFLYAASVTVLLRRVARST
jgi:hypothetical protein